MLSNDELELALRLPQIQRWQIVEVSRPQSVADHSYRVWLLATHLWDTLFPINHNSLDRATLERWALLHDVDEVITGDIPSTVKATMNKAVPGAMGRLKQAVHEQHFPSIEAMFRGTTNTIVEQVVDIADMVEALLYINKYGEEKLRESVVQSLLKRINGLIEQAAKDERVSEAIIHRWINDRLSQGVTAMTRVAKGIPPPPTLQPVQPTPPPATITQTLPPEQPIPVVPVMVASNVQYACGCTWDLASSPSLAPPDACVQHGQPRVT